MALPVSPTILLWDSRSGSRQPRRSRLRSNMTIAAYTQELEPRFIFDMSIF